MWVERDGREEPVGLPAAPYSYPRVSPRGDYLAIESREREQDIWIWDTRQRQSRKLSFDPAIDTLPLWTPDGRGIVWGRLDGTGLNLYTQAADGSGTAQRITDSGVAQRPSSFAPDGRLLVSWGSAASQDFGVMSLAGDAAIAPLLKTSASELNPVVSPNGRWLAYQSDEQQQRFEVLVTAYPSMQGRWQVSSEGGEEPLWSPSGTELFYLDPTGTLMSVPMDASSQSATPAPGRPTPLLPPNGYMNRRLPQTGRSYDITPDGRRFVRLKTTDSEARAPSAANFTVITNWLQELERQVAAD